MGVDSETIYRPYERMSPRERQLTLELMLNSIPRTLYNGEELYIGNIEQINYAAELFKYSKGTSYSTNYGLREISRGWDEGLTHSPNPNRQDPAYYPKFPETFFDEGEGLFGENPMETEANILRGYINSGESHGRTVTMWQGEFYNSYGVIFELIPS
jgi:hypothetical protein